MCGESTILGNRGESERLLPEIGFEARGTSGGSAKKFTSGEFLRKGQRDASTRPECPIRSGIASGAYDFEGNSDTDDSMAKTLGRFNRSEAWGGIRCLGGLSFWVAEEWVDSNATIDALWRTYPLSLSFAIMIDILPRTAEGEREI